MSVTSFIGIVSKARAHILRLTSARLQDLVASDWAARAVLRYWRLRGRTQSALKVLRQHRRRPSVNLVGHMLVLGLGFVLVVPGMTGRAEPTRAIAAQRSVAGSATWTTAARARNAVEMRGCQGIDPRGPTGAAHHRAGTRDRHAGRAKAGAAQHFYAPAWVWRGWPGRHLCRLWEQSRP